jgi:hypothetical protein
VAGPEELGETSSNVETPNRLAVNSLSSNRLAVNRLAVNRLAVNRLAVNGLSLAGDEVNAIAADAGGRELLSYLIGCALPPGEAVEATTVDGTYTFVGSIGLAPAWVDRVPTVSERRWVSACLLARTNLFGVAVKLSLRGDHLALTTTSQERTMFPYYEGNFYGDLWLEDRQMHTCSSSFSQTDPAFATLPSRKCSFHIGDGTTACGFAWNGTCESTCKKGVCEVPSDPGTEVITVYLERISTSSTSSISSTSRTSSTK